MRVTTNHNRVKFLLDEEFFEELHWQLAAVRDAGGDDDGSDVLIAMWLCKLRTRLPAVQRDGKQLRATDLRALLTEIAEKGRRVRFVLWNGSNPIVEPARTALWLGLKAITLNYVDEPLGAGFLRFGGGSKVFADEVRMWCKGHPTTGTYLESYSTGYLTYGTSTHQKIVVCSVGKKLSALVGGFNLNEKYSAELDHATADQGWHDTAVLLEGPAAHTVQEEWLRRWNKQFYVSWSHETLPAGADDQERPKQMRRPQFFTRKVTIATTNGEASPAEKDIRAMVVERIRAAERYIYFENYAFTDPELIDALATKMATDRDVEVMVVIHHPASPLYSTDTLWSYLQYFTFIQLAVARFKQIVVHRAQGDVTLRHPDAKKLDGAPITNLAVQKSKLGWSLTWAGGEGPGTCAVTDVRSFVGRPFMFAPRTTTVTGPRNAPQWPYPHSKLALFDDAYALVGSANWTYRSMEYDGEITAMIDDAEKVAAMREKLLGHWQAGLTIESFAQKAQDNLSKVTNAQMPPNRCFMVPLHLDDFVHPDEATLKTKAMMDAMWTWF